MALTPAEEYQLQQRHAPTPATVHLTPRERAALAAYRERRARQQQERERRWEADPLTRTWMP